MKHEFRKHEKVLYGTKAQPTLIEVPVQRYLCIKGEGNPNSADFAERVTALYSLSYAIRMMPKAGFTPPGYFEYTVYPLEGLWDLNEDGRASATFDKENLVYILMIRQPHFVDQAVIQRAFERVHSKKPQPLLSEVFSSEITDGLAVQMLHVGPFDDEPASFAQMHAFLAEHNLTIKTLVHREIYLSDVRKTAPEKLKTLLRYQVEHQNLE
ncbi:MAG: GyrI-like domain-containing protein [Culicoidibacterales bacterium]